MFKSRLVTHLLGRGRHHYVILSFVMFVAVLFSFFTPTPVDALPAGFQEYLVMGDEYQIYRMFNSIGFGATQEMSSIVTIVATSSGQQIYYDHWEDGYEVNIFSPVMTSTLIFGDGNTANGDSGHGSDLLNQGTVLSLKSYDPSGDAGNLITDTIDVSAPRDVTEIRYDSRDRIVTTGGPVNVVHAVWPYNETYIGGSWEIYSFQAWRNGTFYTIPIGEDSYTNNDGDTGPFADFRDVWLQIQAAEDNTSVTVDNGQDTPVNVTLNQGETYTSLGYKNGASASSIQILEGTTINTDKPVQAGLVTASDGNYQTRFFAMIPDVVWGTEYLVPVASTTDTDGHSQVYLFNPNDFDISVTASDRHPITNTGVITIPANSARAYSQPPPDGMGHVVPGDEASHPENSAARLVSNHIFWAIGSHSFSEINYDWGYSLIPVNFLTSDYYVSWAPGNSNIPPSSGDYQNGSPVHVTPRDDNTTFYVDYGPTDGEIDRTFTLDTLERELIIDPGDDRDNTGMHIWTDNKPFMAVWGETPDYADTSTPYLDLGTTILPLYHGWLDPILSVDKTANPQTLPSVGGVVNFTLDVASYDKILENTNVTDKLPYGWSYVNDSTTITYPNGTTANLNPNINGQNLFWDLNQDLHLNENLQITFDAQVSGLGSSVTEDWETGTYTGGEGWTGNWIETDSTGNSQDPGTGGVQVVQEPSDAHSGEWHLWLRGNGATSQSISRTVDLSDFVNPALDFWRLADSLEASDYFYLDVSHNGGITWTRVLTFVEDDDEGTYVNHRISLVDYQSTNTAIRFIGSSNNSSYDHLYIDDLQILDTATINRNVGIAAGTYMGNKFEASDEAFVYISDLSLDKTVDKNEAAVGEEIIYTLSYTNSGAVTTTNTYIQDVIPVNTTFTGQASAGGTYTTSSNSMTWGPLEVTPGSGDVVTFSVTLDRVPNGTVVENSATIDSEETAESTSNVVQTTILAPALNLSKSAPTTAAAEDTITYTIDYANTGGASATGVIISDTIPANTAYVTGSMAINDGTGNGWLALTDVADGDAGHWNGATIGVAPGVVSGILDPSETGQIRFAVTIEAGTPEGTGIGNVAKVDSDQTNPQSSNMATTEVSPLTIVKASDRAVATAGDIVEFTVTYANKGDLTLNDIYLIDAIPESTTLVSGTVTGAGMSVEYSTDNGQNWSGGFADPANVTDIRWNRTTLISQTQGTVGFRTRLDDPLPGDTTIRNEARITSTETAASGWLYSNEVAVGTVDLSITKAPNAAFVRDGDTITYTITYGNGGSAAASGATIVDQIPENTTYVAGSIAGNGADESDTDRLVWHVGTIPANSGGYKASFVVEVDSGTAPGTAIRNTATLTDAYDSASSGMVQVTVAEDGVTISPDRSDNDHDQGEEVCYAHTVRNTGSLSDTMELSATHSVWTGAAVNFYQDNNLNGERDVPDTALTDTNANSITDTGELEPEEEIEILACFEIPTTGVEDGDTDVLTVQATTWAGGALTYASQVEDTTTVKVYNFIDLDSPADGLITNTSSINVSGTTNPNASVVITNTTTGVTYTITADGAGKFATTITLTLGSNPLEVTSTDANGDVATAASTVNLVNDPTDSENSLVIGSPISGTVTNATTIPVTGTTDPGATVVVTNTTTGQTFTTTADNDGNFSVDVILTDGDNPFSVISTDPFGNVAQEETFVFQTNDPTDLSNSLTIGSPLTGTVTSATTIPVTGTTDPGATVVVTNTATGQTFTATADNDGNFSVDVTLTDGDNPLAVTSTDPFGNVAQDKTRVIVDPTDSGNSLTIGSPLTGTVTSATTIPVTGTTDPGATVVVTNTATGQTFTTTADNDGNFSVDVTLTDTEGENPLTVTSTDPFDNTISKYTTVIKTLPDLFIEKIATDVDGGLLAVGDLIRYAITVTNDTTGTMTGVIVTDTLPAGLAFVSATPGGYTGPNPLVWQVGDLADGLDWTAVITVQVDGTADPIGGNVASVSSDQQGETSTDPVFPPDPGGGDGDGDVSGLLIDKTATNVNGGLLAVGDLIRYAITVTNDTTGTMTGVIVTDTLPAGVAFVAATPGGYTGPNPLVWQVGDLADGLDWTAVITVQVDGTADPIGGNVASVSSDQQGETSTDPVFPPDPGGGDGDGDVSGLLIDKTATDINGGLLEVGDLIRYAITVTNDTTGTMTGVIVTDTLPAGVAFVSATPGGYTGPNPLVWQVGDLADGLDWTAVITVQVDGTADPIGSNVASVSSDQQGETSTDPVFPPDPGGGDGDGDVSGLLIDKTATDINGGLLEVGDFIRYTLHITNDSTISHTNVIVTDTLPDGVFFVSAHPDTYVTSDPVVWHVSDLDPAASWTAAITAQVDGTADPIGGNVASVSSDQQDKVSTDPILPPGGGDVEEPGVCTCDPDRYEPDDETLQAGSLLFGSFNEQTHDFCDDAADWLYFTAEAGNIYTITTSSWGQRADTFLTLFDTDGEGQLQANDDYVGTTDYSSRIVWQAPADGIYYIRVTNQAQLTGCETDYNVWIEVKEKTFIYLPLVTRNHGAALSANVNQNTPPALDQPDVVMAPMGVISHTCPDSYEIDDTWQQASPIESGVVQTHTLDSDPMRYAADKDFVYLDLSEGQTITVTVIPTDDLETMIMLHDNLGNGLGITGTTQLVWTPSKGGRYYLSVGPYDETSPFGCANVAGYDLLITMAERNVIYLPMVTRNF